LALGYLASSSATTAAELVHAGAVSPLAALLLSGKAPDAVRSAAAWALGHIGRHAPSEAGVVAVSGAMEAMGKIDGGADSDASEDLKSKCTKAAAAVAATLASPHDLEKLLRT
jgi:hypothetical protein